MKRVSKFLTQSVLFARWKSSTGGGGGCGCAGDGGGGGGGGGGGHFVALVIAVYKHPLYLALTVIVNTAC